VFFFSKENAVLVQTTCSFFIFELQTGR